MPALLAAQEVSKIYQMGSNSVTALDNVSLEINEGEFVAIQGTSGSGKSTLLNMLGGLDHPTKGEVYFASSCWRSPVDQLSADGVAQGAGGVDGQLIDDALGRERRAGGIDQAGALDLAPHDA